MLFGQPLHGCHAPASLMDTFHAGFLSAVANCRMTSCTASRIPASLNRRGDF